MTTPSQDPQLLATPDGEPTDRTAQVLQVLTDHVDVVVTTTRNGVTRHTRTCQACAVELPWTDHHPALRAHHAEALTAAGLVVGSPDPRVTRALQALADFDEKTAGTEFVDDVDAGWYSDVIEQVRTELEHAATPV